MLLQLIEEVLPQLEREDRLIVIDNASSTPVEEELRLLVTAHGRGSQVQILVNSHDIGGPANLLRCLEVCETEYLFCIGDDDVVASDAVKKIRDNIRSNESAVFFNFARASAEDAQPLEIRGLDEFLHRLPSWSALLFMSTSVLKVEPFKENIRFGFQALVTWAPFQAILIRLLDRGAVMVFPSDVICTEESKSQVSWNLLEVAAGKMLLTEGIANKDHRRKLASILSSDPSPLSLIYAARYGDSIGGSLELNRMYLLRFLTRSRLEAGFTKKIKFGTLSLLGRLIMCDKIFFSSLWRPLVDYSIAVLRR